MGLEKAWNCPRGCPRFSDLEHEKIKDGGKLCSVGDTGCSLLINCNTCFVFDSVARHVPSGMGVDFLQLPKPPLGSGECAQCADSMEVTRQRGTQCLQRAVPEPAPEPAPQTGTRAESASSTSLW